MDYRLQLELADTIITKQKDVIRLFDSWVDHVKQNKLKEAAEIVEKAAVLRLEILTLNRNYEAKKKSLIKTI